MYVFLNTNTTTERGYMTVYLDCNATTPLEPAIQQEMLRFFVEEVGNAGSRTHEYGVRAKQAVERAREAVAAVVDAAVEEVVFTSGATESNNLAILGLGPEGVRTGKRHVVTTAIEHKAVLEPVDALRANGFEATVVPVGASGWVDPGVIAAALRPDTLLVSVMHVNNETGVIQPLEQVTQALADHPTYLHVDAAQGYGKDFSVLRNRRIDLISISGHKIYGPKGIGALIARRRGYRRPPLTPLLYGGGQERGLRPGTLPVPLVVGLGLAAELASRDHSARREACLAYRARVLDTLRPLGAVVHGDPERTIAHAVNLSFPGLDSEALMLAMRDLVAISNGSACTSHSYHPSHVLEAMGLPRPQVTGAIRLSWSHLTPEADWDAVIQRINSLR
jgi:cysteine desulfurase